MKKQFLFLSFFLIFLSLNVLATDTNTLEIVNVQEVTDPSSINEDFTISVQVQTNKDVYHSDLNYYFNPEDYDTFSSITGTDWIGTLFKPNETGKLWGIDYNSISSSFITKSEGALYSVNYDTPDGIGVPGVLLCEYSANAEQIAEIYLSLIQARYDFSDSSCYVESDKNYFFMIKPADEYLDDFFEGGAGGSDFIPTFGWNDENWNGTYGLVWYTDLGTYWTGDNEGMEYRICFETYIDEEAGSFLIDDATVNMKFGNLPVTEMTYSGDSYNYSGNLGVPNTYGYGISATKASNTSDDYNSTFKIIVDLSDFLTVTNLTNVSNEVNAESVNLYPTDEESLIEFKVVSGSDFSLDVPYILENSLNDGRQYFIYTATEAQYSAGTWVFSDSLTYGTSSSYDDPIQKIWDYNGTKDKYIYSFNDTLISYQTKYYRITYRVPAVYYETIKDSSDWFKQLEPGEVEVSNKTHDLYTVSGFSNLRNELIESIPQLLSTDNVAFEIQFTAFTESDVTIFKAGLTNETGTSDSTNDLNITTVPTRFSIDINSLEDKQRLLLKTNETSSKTIYVTDYALIERGHFINRLKITKENNVPLDVIVSTVEGVNVSNPYIREGKISEARSAAYDREGDLNKLVLEVWLDAANDTNRVAYFETELSDFSAETYYNIIETIPAIIDLNGTATNPDPFRIIKIALTLYDEENLAVEEQSAFFDFIQWPYFPDDIEFFIISLGKKVAEFPAGRFNLVTKDPSAVLGIKLRIFDEGSTLSDPDYSKVFYKDIDFSCDGLDCSFEWVLDNWKYEDENTYTIAGTVLVNTENENTENYFLHKEIKILVSYRELETFRVLETFERTDHEYRNTEEIGLVLQARSSDYSNLKKSLKVLMTLQNCDAASGGNCVAETTQFTPLKFLYDSSTGYNYWFWKQLFIDDDGSLLDDGNFYRVLVSATDLELKHEQTGTALLTAKCDVYSGDFISNMLATLNHFLFGCTTPSPEIVSTTDNNANEIRLDINASAILEPPTYEGLLCLSPNNENVYLDATEQPLFCAVYYTVGENPIDSFDFKVLNENSDESISDENERQFLKETIPFDLIAFNDLVLMQKALEKEGNEIDTLAEFFAEGFNYLATGTLNPVIDSAELLTNEGIITNLGFDVNLTKAFSPTNIGGAFFIRIDGIKIINQNDYIRHDGVENLNPVFLRRYANLEGFDVPVENTKITFFASDFKKVIEKETSSPLVINVNPAQQQAINQENTDENQTNFSFVPTQLNFDIISSLYYNNELSTIRRFLSMTLLYGVTDKFDFSEAIELYFDCFSDLGGCISAAPGAMINFLYANLLTIFIILCIAGIVVFLYAKLRG